ncbi:glycosyltransferase [Lacihabitans sp. LS3-19]|uniref:glycosyltransferase family 4 protein n=1 Tax=Lacihabitans sp. LS3-19 TaxID=2487335 RepID=UPI0020CE92A6|nr:glycosyltransferase family 4 protein [Lacihabitans sp. LS3-19]MCP9767643.1 glycosyltransferase [Lacihabitans sp. LS3-19]
MKKKPNILFISHDANRAGAQLFLLSIMKYFKSLDFGIVLLVINEWGTLNDEFEENFATYYLNSSKTKKSLFKRDKSILDQIKSEKEIDFIYANTIASVDILPEIKSKFNKPIITHIHELGYSIAQYGSENALDLLFGNSEIIIACSEAVGKNLEKHKNSAKIQVVHSFVENDRVLDISKTSSKNNVKVKYGFDSQKTWIGACGNADWRKAPDIFLLIAKSTLDKSKKFGFVWIGIKEEDPLLAQLKYDAEKLGISENILWISPTPQAVEIINALDIFMVCSREDPFPLVMLEAALCNKPILGFKNTGGADEFIEEDCGKRVNYLDIFEMSENVTSLNDEDIKTFGKNAKNKVLEKYNFEVSIKKIERIINKFY